ncbi:MAG: hypothetical protein H5U03_05305 [Clostridia bacterium]|nr:hypothetical protein [Clostridia bacterium]
MFTGDNLLPHITPNPVLELCLDGTGARVLSLPTYIATLTKLEDMPVRKGLPGHGGEIPNVKERIAEIKQHHGLRTGEVRAILVVPPGSFVQLVTHSSCRSPSK